MSALEPASAQPPHPEHDEDARAIATVLERVRCAPLFEATRPVLTGLLEGLAWPTLDQLSRVAGVRCEPDRGGGRRRGERRRADLYDARITEQGVLPTRPRNWHDLFNAVTWATFPRAKRALHARQYRRLCERVPERFVRLPGERSDEQSALTQLDEGGVLLSIPAGTSLDAQDALTAHLRELVVQRVPLTAEHLRPFDAKARVFGHALHEHLALGSPTPRAAVWLLPHPPAQLDDALARLLLDEARPFGTAPVSAWMTPELATGP